MCSSVEHVGNKSAAAVNAFQAAGFEVLSEDPQDKNHSKYHLATTNTAARLDDRSVNEVEAAFMHTAQWTNWLPQLVTEQLSLKYL